LAILAMVAVGYDGTLTRNSLFLRHPIQLLPTASPAVLGSTPRPKTLRGLAYVVERAIHPGHLAVDPLHSAAADANLLGDR
jgi:hypothetical protein